jgi:hypothetical protein
MQRCDRVVRRPTSLTHIGFIIVSERLGILVHPPTDTGGSVGYWTMVRDPDGHGVEFTCGQPIEGLE